MATGPTRKKVTLPAVENTADAFDYSPDLQECLSEDQGSARIWICWIRKIMMLWGSSLDVSLIPGFA
jgi:hypothetical protein